MIKLDKEVIDSFVGNVVPLRLLGVEKFGLDPIIWHLSGEGVKMRTFTPDTPSTGWYGDVVPFTDGVLLTLCNPGKACVTAVFEGKEYTCQIRVRQMKKASSDDDMNFYVGDMHIHTSNACSKPNGREFFANHRQEGACSETLSMMHDEGRLDTTVVSDHACFVNRKEFFRGFLDAEDICGDELIVFAGAESEIVQTERDRFGIPRINSGEIVTHNADQWAGVRCYDDFLRILGSCPYAFCTLAHPNFFSIRTRGQGSFSLRRNNTPRFQRLLRYVEMGDGTDRGGNLIHENMFTEALDNGFRVSTTCSSDSHSLVWGYERIPGKTIVMAPEKSREAFLDAFLSCRAYASSTGNVKVRYSVNGHHAPTTLPWGTKYRFHVEISYFYQDPTTEIVGAELISDGGVPVMELAPENFSNFDFEYESDKASWFFLRLWDRQGRRTWSVPIWTGREPALPDTSRYEPLEKTGFTVVEEKSGKDASVLVNDDPFSPWRSDGETASLLMDMQEKKDIRGLGVYPRSLYGPHIQETGKAPNQFLAEFPFRYVISTSADGESFRKMAEGVFRSCSEEEIVPFVRHDARFIRLEILSTVGKNCKRPEFAHAKIAIAELTPFTRAEKEHIRPYFDAKMEEKGNYLFDNKE